MVETHTDIKPTYLPLYIREEDIWHKFATEKISGIEDEHPHQFRYCEKLTDLLHFPWIDYESSSHHSC